MTPHVKMTRNHIVREQPIFFIARIDQFSLSNCLHNSGNTNWTDQGLVDTCCCDGTEEILYCYSYTCLSILIDEDTENIH